MTGPNITRSISTLALAICAALAAAYGGTPSVLVAVCAIAAALLAIVAIRARATLENGGASRSRVAASSAASMAQVWVWGALAIVITYQLIPPWREWWHFGLAFAIAGAACLFFARIHDRDAAANRDDETMLKLGHGLAVAQLLGTLATMVGLILDPNKTFQDMADPAWAANIYFFSGAAALAAISTHAVLTNRPSKA